MSRPGFQVPNVTVTSARTAVPSTTPVSASTPLGRSTATTVAADRPASPASVAYGSRRPPFPPMPSMPSRIRSAVSMAGATAGSSGLTMRPPAARTAAAPPSWILEPVAPGHSAGARRGRRGARAPGAGGRGAEGAAAVVAAAGQHHGAGAVDAAQQLGADPGQAGRGPLHQRP